ncbi:MAG: lamin tail domain-containing protein, partial [Planctomycetales bacterium]|nr:lamin tail domain-containing protein [Planctomycetales bacterium]
MRRVRRRVRRSGRGTAFGGLRVESLEPRQLLTGTPVITEFLALNESTNIDEDGVYSDWIEIHNPDSAPLELTGWHLTDDDQLLDKWTFPAVTLAADEYLVVWASGLNRLGTGPQAELHTNFRMSGGGEYLALVAPDGENVVQEFNTVAGGFPPQVADISYGLVPGTVDETYFLTPTPGGVNGGATSDNPTSPVVISEIMYHPDSLRDSEEYLELHSIGSSAIDLSGWRFSAGVDFQFPPGTVLSAGGYVVVTADKSAFLAKYSTVDPAIVYGDWTGHLSNSSEDVELEDAEGNFVDRVRYADQGDWAQRERGPLDQGHRGWQWNAPHDAGGRSLELVNPQLPNDYGQNWGSSAMPQGTPGAPNSIADSNIAPIIVNVEQSVWIPHSTDTVTVTATVRDELDLGTSMALFYRLDGAGGGFAQVAMYDDGVHGDGGSGDRTFAANIPPQPNRAIIEFYVRAVDGQGNARTWPAPALQLDDTLAQTANALYQVDNSFTDNYQPGDAPTVYVVMTEAERAELAQIGSGSQAEAESNAQMNATYIMFDGTGMSARYTAGVRNRGSSSRNDPPNNHRINLPSDRPWNGIDSININSKYTPSQALGTVIYQAAGLVSEDGRPIQLHINGTNLATNDATMFGTYVQLEALNSDFANNHFPGNSDGNLYSIRDALPEEGDLRYEGTNPDAYRDTYFKETNEDLDDWSDLIALTAVLNNTTDAQFFEAVSAVADLEQWFRFFAADTLLVNREGGLPTGRGDDYTMYRGNTDTRFVLIPHDLDTLLGQGGSSTSTSYSLFTYEGVNGMARLFSHPATVPLYYQHLLELAHTVFEPQRFGAYVDQILGPWVSPQVAQNYKDTAAARRAYVLSQIPTELTVSSSLPRAGQAQILRTTNGSTVGLSGQSHAARTRSVLVNGVAANWSARNATWSLNTLSLTPGINRVIVQAFDGANGSGNVIDTRTIDIWYDRGAMTEVTQVNQPSVSWTAAHGPYHLAQDVTVPAGTTLTIQPGTSVFFDEGVELRVEGTLVAEGTPYQRIRFSSVPDAPFVPDTPRDPGLPEGPPRWAGIHLVDTMASANIIAYADVEYAQDNDSNQGSIGVIDSQAVLDNLTFRGTHLRTIYGESPSWIISNSVFASVFAADERADALGLDNVSELIKSTGVTPAGGRYIIRGNVFGTNKGHNDVIDADSGRVSDGVPIVQIVNNIFTGTGDEHIDLGGDVYVAGNVFMNVFKDDETSDRGYANAISTGDAGAQTTIVVSRNVFWEVDHAINLKRDAATLFENNTVVAVHPDFIDAHGNPNVGSAINLYVDEPGATTGEGAFVNGNIFWNVPRLFGNADIPSGTVSQLELARNFIDPLLANSTVGTRPGTLLNLSDELLMGNVSFVDAVAGNFMLGEGSPARGTGPFGMDFGALVPEGIWIADVPPAVTPFADVTLVVGGPGIMAYRYRVNGGAWSTEIPIGAGFAFSDTEATARTAALTLSGLADGPYTLEVIGKEYGGTWQDEARATTVEWTVDTVGPPPFDVVINEVLAANSTAFALGGTHPDAIELYNRGAVPVDLGGYSLTDDLTQPDRFVFPNGTILGAGEYLVVYADSLAPVANEIHVGFGLQREGEAVFLIDWANQMVGEPVDVVDSVEFGRQLVDRSIGRLPAAGWGLAVPTLGGPNVAQPLGTAEHLYVNEWFAKGGYTIRGQRYSDDFVELYNASSLPVPLGGLYLTDDPVSEPDKHAITELSYVEAGGYAVFYADGNVENGAEHVGFRLSDERGWIGLLDSELNQIDLVYYGPQTTSVSQGRMPDGGPQYQFFAQPSPGIDTTPPSVPLGITLDLANSTRVDFHWSAAMDEQTGVAAYQVYRNGQLIGTSTGTSYSDTTVLSGDIYFYQVAAVNGDGVESGLSASISNARDDTPPSIPRGLSGTIVSANRIDLSWDASSDPESGVQYYTIWRNGLEIGTTVDTTYSDTSTNVGSLTTYHVTATNNQSFASAVSAAWNVVGFKQDAFPNTDYTGTVDTWINGNNGQANTNYANDVELSIDGSDPLETLGLIRWDTSLIPAGSTISSVAITVNINNSTVGGQDYEIYAARRNWVEDEATWNNAAAGVLWQTSGAAGTLDRGPEILGVMTPTALGVFTYGLNAAGIALVQHWVDDASENFGFIIADDSNNDGMEFDSSEAPVIANRPQLTISYTLPGEPLPAAAA